MGRFIAQNQRFSDSECYTPSSELCHTGRFIAQNQRFSDSECYTPSSEHRFFEAYTAKVLLFLHTSQSQEQTEGVHKCQGQQTTAFHKTETLVQTLKKKRHFHKRIDNNLFIAMLKCLQLTVLISVVCTAQLQCTYRQFCQLYKKRL
jgi:hypothetical protein